MEFEWDDEKDLINQRKHGLSFHEARRLFESGIEYLEIFDADHSEFEDRFITEPEESLVRIIGARLASKRERDSFRSRMDPQR